MDIREKPINQKDINKFGVHILLGASWLVEHLFDDPYGTPT